MPDGKEKVKKESLFSPRRGHMAQAVNRKRNYRKCMFSNVSFLIITSNTTSIFIDKSRNCDEAHKPIGIKQTDTVGKAISKINEYSNSNIF